MQFREMFDLLKQTVDDWSNDKAPRLAAALAYYAVFSIAPLLVVALAIAGLVFGREAAQGQVASQIEQMVGPTSAKAIQDMLANAQQPSHGIFATVVGTATLLLGAGGVFGALQDSLNTIWGVAPKPSAGWLKLIKDRFLSFTMVLGLGFMLMISLVMSAGIAAIGGLLGRVTPGVPWLWESINTVLSLGVFTLLFAMIYKVLPDAKVQWRDVWIGAFGTALLFTLGKIAIGLYLGRGSIGSAYGAAGSLVVLLLWIYYSSQILFFGAEFTKVYAIRHGARILPDEDAIALSPEARAEQGLSPEAPNQPGSKSGAQQVPSRAAGQLSYPAHVGPGLPAGSQPRANHAMDEIRMAGLVGAAIGLIVGLLREGPRRPVRH